MKQYDVVIVGARVAGAATALLLARAGHRVVVVDRARRGSDTLSTHALMRPAVLQLERWGVLPAIVVAGTPGHRRVTFHYGDEAVDVATKRHLYAPRRTVLDPALVAAAEAAGARFRFGVDVRGLQRDADGTVTGIRGRDASGATVLLGGRITVGADGRRSRVAREVTAPVVHRGSTASAFVYGYWSGVATSGFEWCFSPGSTAGLIPTDGGLTCVFVGVPAARFGELRSDLERSVHDVLRRTSATAAERVARGRLAGRVRGFPGMPSLLHRPWGPGWTLVGDAGYWKDPATAHGISDALRDAELVAAAIDAGLCGHADMDDSLAAYAEFRDELSLPMLAATDAVAGFGWDLPGVQRLHLRMSETMQREVEVLAARDGTSVADQMADRVRRRPWGRSEVVRAVDDRSNPTARAHAHDEPADRPRAERSGSSSGTGRRATVVVAT